MNSIQMAYRGRFNDGGLVALIGALICYVLIYSHLMSFLTSKAGIPSTIISLVIIGLGAIMVSGVLIRRKLPRSSLMIMAAIAAYFPILLVSLLFLDESVLPLVRMRLTWIFVALGAIVLLSNLRSPRQFLLIVRGVVMLSAFIVFAEFFSGFSLPVVMTTVTGRAAGLFENPNSAALFVAMAVPVVTIGLRPFSRAFWYALSLTCVFLTFSRGGLALCAGAILMVEAFPLQRGGATTLKRLLVCVLLVVGAVSLYGLISAFVLANFSNDLDANTVARVQLQGDSASDYRLFVLKLAWQEFAASPIWGHGTGAGDRWLADVSVHNQLGLVAVEYGAIGVAWFTVFFAALWSLPRPFGIWATSLFFVASMMSHNLMDGATHAVILATYVALPSIFAVPRGRTPANRPLARFNLYGGTGRLGSRPSSVPTRSG